MIVCGSKLKIGEAAIELNTEKPPKQPAVAADNSLSAMMAVRSTRPPSQPVEQTDWWDIAWKPIAFSLAILGLLLIYRGGSSLATGRARATLASHSSQKQPAKKPIGEARCGDRLMGRNPLREQADLGARRVVSIIPKPTPDFLYNLETTEHVFRVGSLGTLVHNACVTQAYGGPGGGHIFSKRAFEGIPGYNANNALAIGPQELRRLGLKHLGSDSLTTTQQRLFREFAASGRPNTLAEHARIARETLIEHGVDPKDAASAVRKALNQLKSWGITAPVHIPWGG